MPAHISRIEFIQQVAIELIYVHSILGSVLMGGGGGVGFLV